MTKSLRHTTDPRVLKNREYFQRIVDAEGSQERAAAKIGVSQAALSRWVLRGWCSPKRAKQIEELWGVPRRYLVHPDVVDALFN